MIYNGQAIRHSEGNSRQNALKEHIPVAINNQTNLVSHFLLQANSCQASGESDIVLKDLFIMFFIILFVAQTKKYHSYSFNNSNVRQIHAEIRINGFNPVDLLRLQGFQESVG